MQHKSKLTLATLAAGIIILLLDSTFWLKSYPALLPSAPQTGPPEIGIVGTNTSALLITAPTITVMPSETFVNTPTTITFQARIPPDGNLITSSPTLLRLVGTSWTNIGRLYDDGTHRDNAPGDHIYTAQALVTESELGAVSFRASVAYRGQLKRIFSNTIAVNISAQSFADPELGLTMLYPHNWFTRQELGTRIFSNVQQLAPLSTDALTTQSFFQMRRLAEAPGKTGPGSANPGLLPINEWFDQYFSEGFAVPPLSMSTGSVNGHSAVRVETAEGGIRVHVYISKEADIVEVTYGLFAPQFVGVYEAMLGSMKF